MSLFGRKNLNLDDFTTKKKKGPEKGKKQKSTNSLGQRKQTRPRFQIAETALEIDSPFLGKGSVTSSSFLSSLATDSDSLFSSLDLGSKSSSKSNLKYKKSNVLSAPTPAPNKLVEQALASSKLNAITSEGPIEANPRIGKRKLKAAKKHAKSLTKGAAWFNMAKAEVTKEKKNDLDVLKLRSAMEGIHHYKRNNMTHTPKYFQVGTIVETKADFYSARIPKKQRKKTLAEEFGAEYGAL